MAGRSRFVTYVFPFIAAAALAGGAYSITKNTPQRSLSDPVIPPPVPPVSSVSGSAKNGRQSFIGAAGIVQPSSEQIDIGSNLSGVVARVFVTVGANVKAGDPLFMLDDREARAEVASQTFQAKGATARIRELLEGIPAAEARLSEARADTDDKRAQVRLIEQVGDRRAVSQQDVLTRRYALAGSEARMAQAIANLRLLKNPDGSAPTIDVQRVQAEQYGAATAKAQATLDRHMMRAPMDAKILQINVRPGEFALAGVLTTPLVVMGVVDPLRVRVDIDESDIARFRPDGPAFATLRGAAETRAALKFIRIEPLVVAKTSLTGSTIERVDTRVMRVIYQLSPADLPALPGQQVDVFIEGAPMQAGAANTSNKPVPRS
jgi:HlyD family secretion protein